MEKHAVAHDFVVALHSRRGGGEGGGVVCYLGIAGSKLMIGMLPGT